MINGTSLFTITVGASIGATNYLMSDNCHVPIAMILAGSSFFTTGYGVRLAQRISNTVLTRLVGLSMLAMVPLIYIKESTSKANVSAVNNFHSVQEFCHELNIRVGQQFSMLREKINAQELPEYMQKVFAMLNLSETSALRLSLLSIEYNMPYIIAGLISGFISGLLGLGGGILMTSFMTAATDMSQTEVIGTSLLAIVPIGMSSTYHNLILKNIHFPTAAAIGSTLCVAVFATSKYITLQVPERELRQVFGATLAISSFAMLRKTL